MDSATFDRLTRLLGAAPTRRAIFPGIAALLGLLPAAEGHAQPKRRRFGADGPCGDGGPKANACRRHRDCCTRVCDRKAGRCRCRRQGEACTQDRNCCRRGGQQLTCQDGRCLGPPPVPTCGTGGACRVFVSSTQQTGDLDGLDGADALCQGLADDAGLPGTYLAWLSDADASPSSRFPTQSTGPYVLVDGTVIADDWQELTSGTLRAPIDLTQQEDRVPAWSAWTYTRADGSAGNESVHCDAWTSDTSVAFGGMGLTNRTNEWWTRTSVG